MSTELQLLDDSRPADRSRWLSLWSADQNREVHGHPDYVRLFAAPGDRVVCATLVTDRAGVLLPLILRPLSREAWAGDNDERWDATSPYGYGGPFYWGHTEQFASEFWASLSARLADERVVCAFIRFTLGSASTAGFPVAPCEAMANIVRSLDIEADQLWRDYAAKVRKNVRRARRLGLRVEVDTHSSKLDEFLDIYYGTMRRRQARDSFYFPRTFFESLLTRLPENSQLFHVVDKDEVVSTELVLLSKQRMYSFLGGTRQEALNTRANDLLKHEIISWGATRGMREFVLGGGYGANDGIYRYKLAFAPSGATPFYIGKLTLDEDAVAKLVAQRVAWSQAHSTEWSAAPGFFPPYRG